MGYLGTKPANSPLTSELIPDGIISTADIAPLAVTPAKMSQKLTVGTAVASTSGTSIDFTGIPSWAKRITIMFSDVSTNGTSIPRLQLGVGGTPTTSGYVVSSSVTFSTGAATVSTTNGFDLYSNLATYALSGTIVFTNVSGNTWVGTANGNYGASLVATFLTAGTVTLSGVLNMVRFTTTNGTDAFDSGTMNIMYEG